LYIARIRFDLPGWGACLIVLAMLNVWVVLPKDHNADNMHIIHGYTLSL
jgi:cell division FtsZ-interacting protein ZapD